MSTCAADWAGALVDVLLPLDVSAGLPIRLDCNDDAVAEAGQRLGIAQDLALDELIRCLHDEHLVDPARGVAALAAADAGDPPIYLLGLALSVQAASRMVSDDHSSMQEYYGRLAKLLNVPLADNWPQVRGIQELVARFESLQRWMAENQNGRRGLLDLPREVHPEHVGVPINQSLLRAGDRLTLGAFFERAARLLDAGWDPVHQLRAWGGSSSLTAPLQRLLDRPDLHEVLASALRAARASWDGSIVDSGGRRLLACQLSLHVPPLPFTLAVTVPALGAPYTGNGPGGDEIKLHPTVADAVPLSWLTHAATGPVIADAHPARVRVLPGPTILFELAPVGIRSVAVAAEDPLWVLTCDERLIAACPSERQIRGPLPDGWSLLCDIEPELLDDDMRARRDVEQRPLAGVATVGGLALGNGAWLLDHPPSVVCDVPEPAPVYVDHVAHGYIDPGEHLDLASIGGQAGVHHIDVGEQELTVELVERGPRDRIGTLGFDADQRHVMAGARALDDVHGIKVIGAVIDPPADIDQLPLMVRYRCPVDVIDADGTKRNLAPPTPAAWLDHVGLPQDGPWEIDHPDKAAWLCVDAPGRRFVVACIPVDVPCTDDVLDVVEWYGPDVRIVDRSDGKAHERWRRLAAALEVDPA